MSEPRQDPADTQMFRAFVERGESEPRPRRWLLPAALLAVLVAVAVLLALTLG